ncbi:hypothetical protein SLS62_010043 [Diatrype stigma]|uniref:Uncharacterized protein n=1 Tax=Diatrype stigma TaxID=117547 RepID=A0AAN9UAY8_9PEZI
MQPLGSIKKWLGHKKKKTQGSSITAVLAADIVNSEVERSYLSNGVAIVSDFTPQAKGSEATLAWLEQRTPDALGRLLSERDRAEKQNSRGPRTKGTKEVKDILMKPCRTTVEQLQNVRNQAELTVRYGATTGAVVYNLGKSLGRTTRSSAPKLPSLQLKDFSTMVREHLELVSQFPGSSLNPMSLRTSLDPGTLRRTSTDRSLSLSPVRGRSRRRSSRKGDGRRADLSSIDSRMTASAGKETLDDRAGRRGEEGDNEALDLDSDSNENDPYEEEGSLQPFSYHRTPEEEWEAREATFVSMVQVSTQVVRKVHIKRPRRKELRPMSRISEVSTQPQ